MLPLFALLLLLLLLLLLFVLQQLCESAAALFEAADCLAADSVGSPAADFSPQASGEFGRGCCVVLLAASFCLLLQLLQQTNAARS